MATINEKMLLIQSLDWDANLKLSDYTGMWFVSANVQEGGDGLLTSICEHRSTPEEAVSAFLDVLKSVQVPKYLVNMTGGVRQHYRWNGAAFREIPLGVDARR